MKPKHNIEQLKQIRKVAPPAYLLNKIHARIEEQKQDKIAPSWIMSLAAAIALLAMFNVMHLRSDTTQYADDAATEVSSTMDLIPSNQLYYE